MAVTQDFTVAVRSFFLANLAGKKGLRVISDARDFGIQTADVSAACRHLTEMSIKLLDARSVIVVGATLSKLQAARVFDGLGIPIVRSMEEARAILDGYPAAA